mgnify:FL=1
MVTVALQATAQITILSMDDVKKSEPIDELVFRAQYELKMVEDTTKTDCQPNSETMMLEVGKKCSQFYSYTTYLRDSTLIATMLIKCPKISCSNMPRLMETGVLHIGFIRTILRER